jgi:hypothetical protein
MTHKFFFSIFSYLMFAGTMFFAAGAVADPIAAGGNDAGDPGADDGAANGDPGADAGEDSSGSDNQSADEPGADKPGIDGKPQADAQLDGRTMPPKVRETLDALKATDPKAHAWMKDRLFENREFKKELPGGLAELKTLKTEVATFKKDFPDVAAVKTEIAEWRGIDEAWNKADPKVIDTWFDMNPEATAKLVPVAMNKLASTNPEHYQHYMAQVLRNTLVQSGVKQNLGFLNRLISAGDKDGATALLKEVTDWMAAVDDTAQKAPVAPQKDPKVDDRNKSLDDRESKIWANETAGQINPFRASLIRKEATQYLPKGAELDDETFEALDRQISVYMDKEFAADPDFIKTFAAYSEAKDTAGLVAYMRQKLETVLRSQPGRNGQPAKMGPVERAVKLFFRGATPAKKAPVAGTVKPGAAAQPQKGWTKVAAGPKPHEIDRTQSDFGMIAKQQAILKDGKKVYWGNQIPT